MGYVHKLVNDFWLAFFDFLSLANKCRKVLNIRENTELYDFELTAEEMTRINALDRNEKHDWH